VEDGGSARRRLRRRSRIGKWGEAFLEQQRVANGLMVEASVHADRSCDVEADANRRAESSDIGGTRGANTPVTLPNVSPESKANPPARTHPPAVRVSVPVTAHVMPEHTQAARARWVVGPRSCPPRSGLASARCVRSLLCDPEAPAHHVGVSSRGWPTGHLL
jgi:hypothetical protein